jgi:hypothetical protein
MSATSSEPATPRAAGHCEATRHGMKPHQRKEPRPWLTMAVFGPLGTVMMPKGLPGLIAIIIRAFRLPNNQDMMGRARCAQPPNVC